MNPTVSAAEAPAARAARNQGFSLVEVAAAVSLLGILTISTLLTLVPVSRQTRLNRELESASAAARNVLEQVQATPYNEIVGSFPDGQTTSLTSLQSGTVVISYADATADPLVMTVTVAWDSPQVGPMSRVFTTVKTE